MKSANGMEDVISLVAEVGGLGVVGPDEDIYEAGFSSIGALQLLVELEARWEVTLADEEFVNARTARELYALLARNSLEAGEV